MNNNAQASQTYNKRHTDTHASGSNAPPPLSTPPSLESATRSYTMATPPDSPPPLARATVPAPIHPPDSVSNRSSSSPDAYSPTSHSQLLPLNGVNGHGHTTYSQYRSGTTTYQEQSQGAGYTYVHTTPISHSPSSSGSLNGQGMHGASFSYTTSHAYDNLSHEHSTPSPPMSSISSRHSISHISHPQPYPNGLQSSGGPSSPESTASVTSTHTTSGPTTPSYTGYNDEGHYGVVLEPSPELQGLAGGHVNSHGQLINGYTSMIQSNSISNRFDSPPPILAPIQGDRATVRGDQHQRMPPYMQHSQMSNDYQYQQSHLGLGHSGWKSESGLRSKGIGALVQ
jgi:zinc finger protein CreA/MIG